MAAAVKDGKASFEHPPMEFQEGDQIARWEFKIRDGHLVIEFLIWNTGVSKMRTIQTGIGHLVEVR